MQSDIYLTLSLCKEIGGNDMKKFKKAAAFISTLALAISCLSCTVFAFDNGYNHATEYTGSTLSNCITSATQTDWYKFTLASDEVPTNCTLTLTIPDNCVYNLDLRYREGSSGRPKVIANESTVSKTRRRTIRKVLTEPGTYFVRVYSQNGTKDTLDSYSLKISYGKNTSRMLTFTTTNLAQVGLEDWAVCAQLLGNYTLTNNFPGITTTRNYKNASVFVKTNYESDNLADYSSEKKATPEQTAIAADYFYSGDLMINPRFKAETNKIYSMAELMNYVGVLNEPVIFYLEHPQSSLKAYKKYVILKDINIGANTITYYNPSSNATETVDYDDFLTNGFEYAEEQVVYSGTNIVNTNSYEQFQAIYN